MLPQNSFSVNAGSFFLHFDGSSGWGLIASRIIVEALFLQKLAGLSCAVASADRTAPNHSSTATSESRPVDSFQGIHSSSENECAPLFKNPFRPFPQNEGMLNISIKWRDPSLSGTEENSCSFETGVQEDRTHCNNSVAKRNINKLLEPSACLWQLDANIGPKEVQ